jgi:hypothetical protein
MRKLAFVDLDLTLFDYTVAREGATYAALLAMDVDCDLKDAIKLMNSLLIPHGDLLIDAGLPNFRREWKAPELFALLSLLCQRRRPGSSGRRFKDFLSRVGNGPLPEPGISASFRRRQQNVRLLRRALESAHAATVIGEVNDMLQTAACRSKIDDASAAFDEYLRKKAARSKGVDELFTNLRSRGFEVYIVSEGDEGIQRDKVSMLGLSEHTDGLYVSSSCCRSEQLVTWLWNEATEVSTNERNNLSVALGILYDEALQYSNKTASLFRKVLHTVLLPPLRRVEFYGRFGWLSEAECHKQRAIHVLVFGDRYDKDLYPAIEAFKDVITIRLLSGKYSKTYQSDFVGRSDLPKPNATVDSVSKAAIYVENLPPIEGLPPSNALVPPADPERIDTVQRAFEVIRFSIDKAPSWVLDQIEGLVVALRGSEITTDE